MKKIFMKLLVLVAFILFAPNIFALELTENLTLEDDSTECYEVKSGDITIDLNGHSIICATTDAIAVDKGAKLTVKGEGLVQSTKLGFAALYNNGTVVLNGGTFKSDDSVTKYYAILNHGIMTINENVTVLQTNHTTSSLIDNGYSAFKKSELPRQGYDPEIGLEEPKLTINGGTFDGGLNTIKNDDNAILVINDGHFTNNVQVAVQNWNIATINGGTYDVPTGKDKTTLFIGSDGKDDEVSINKGSMTINGGTFNGEYILEFGSSKGVDFAITDGIFNSSVGFINPKNSNGTSRPGLGDITSYSIRGGVFTDVNITPDEGYSLVPIGTDFNGDGVNDVLVTEVQLTPPVEVGLKVDETYDTELDKNIKKYGTWTTTDSEVATVDNGIISAHKKGTATVKVVFNGDTRTYEVKVTRTKVNKPTTSGTYTYNGEEQTLALTGFDEELMTVNGNIETNAGDYVAHVSLKNTVKYEWADGSDIFVDLEWTILKLEVVKPTLEVNEFTYTGKLITPEVTGYDNKTMTVTGDESATVVGEYEITYSLKNTTNYKWADGKTTDVIVGWTIEKAKVNKPELPVDKFVYTKEEITPEFMGFDPEIMEMTGDTNGLLVNEYEIVIGLKDKTNYEWADETVEDLEYAWTIEKAKLVKPTLEENNIPYTASVITPNVVGYDETTMSVSGDLTATIVGEYELTYSLKDTANYEWADGKTTNVVVGWNVVKAQLPKPKLVKTEYAYTGNVVVPEVTGFDEDLIVAEGDVVGIEVGEYETIYSLKDNKNYEWENGRIADVALDWNIVKASVAKPTLTTSIFTYTGEELSIEVTGYDNKIMTVTGDEKATNVGNYEVVYSLKDKENYLWADGTTADVHISWNINKAKVVKPSITEAIFEYTGKEIELEINDYDESLMTLTGEDSATNAGEYRLVFALKDKNNYEWDDKTTTNVTLGWQILKAKVVKPRLVETVYTYTGEDIVPELVDFDEDLMTLGGTYMGSPVGTYTIKVSLTDSDNYEWTNGSSKDVELEWMITFGVPKLEATSTYNSIKLSWTKVDGAAGYQVYECNSKGKSCSKLATVTKLTYTDKKLKFNKKYYYKVRAFRKDAEVNIYGKFSDLVSKKTALTQTKITVSKDRYRNVLVEWKKVSGAKRYYVYRCNIEGENCKNLGFANDLDFVNTNAKEGVTYTYKVRPYRDGIYGPYSNLEEGLRLDDTIEYSVKNTAYKTNTITISNLETATKFYIYRSTSKNGKYKKIKTIKANEEGTTVFNDKDVSFNKKYYYKVKAYNGVNDSDYSAKKSVTTNKIATPSFEIETELSYVTININRVAGATGYQILYSVDGEDFETLTKTTELSYDKRLPDDTYRIKVRAYRKVGSKYYYSSYSTVQEFTISTEK